MKRLLKIAGWTLLAILLLIAATLTVAVSYLTPSRLTPLVERVANDYLRADVSIKRMEISFWSTFPKFVLEIDTLEVRTRAFESSPDSLRRSLPAWSDSLLSIRHLDGAVNIPRLLTGYIHLYDINIDHPEVNLVQASPSVWSLDIFPSSDDDGEEHAPTPIPGISLSTFMIKDGMPVRYLSIPDSIDASVNLSAATLSGTAAPLYKLDIRGLASASIPDLTVDSLSLGLGGDIRWNPSEPLAIALHNLVIAAGSVSLTVNSEMNLADGLRLNTFDATLPSTPLDDILHLIPGELRGDLDNLHPDFSIKADMALTHPFSVGTDSIPSFRFSAHIPQGSAIYDGFSLDKIQLDISGDIDGRDLDRSTIELKKLTAMAHGMGFALSCSARNIISDPAVKGRFEGGLNISRLPRRLLSGLPGTIKGILLANCDFDLRRSYLDKENFHRMRIKGEATLKDLDIDVPEMPMQLSSRLMKLNLGTQTSIMAHDVNVDSMLTASLTVDTISFTIPGIELHGGGLKAGIGCRNTSSSSDTTLINPIGGRIIAERLIFRSSEDSMRVRLRKATVGASLTRHKGDAKKPRLHLDISTERAIYGDRLNRAALTNAFTSVTINPSTPRISRRMQARMDSLHALYPTLPDNSLRMMARQRRRTHVADSSLTAGADSVFDLEVDNSMKKLLHQWNAHGVLRADRMRLFTPLFPLRNRVTGLDVRFNSDSIIITDTRFRVGHSDFLLQGTISNITRALTSASAKRPLLVNLNLRSDTIDINEIAAAVFAGAAFAENDNGLITVAPAASNSDILDNDTEMPAVATDTAMTVLVIPSNVEASVNVSADNIIYSNLVFHDFKGAINSYRGALNLSELSARSDVGSMGLNALYTAPTKHDASFAFGLNVNNFNIGEFLKLVPAVDSLMPLMQDIRGIISADLAATTRVDSAMNIDIPSLKAAMKISGDSLQIVDKETFRKIGKWLLFKHKERNIIDSMTVEMIIDNSQLRMFPFMFNLDRYKLGVMGSNDLALNFDYHVAVLKSPIPFKFGINISGNIDDMKIRLGRARFNEKNMSRTISIADTTRINLVREIRNVFRRGVSNARVRRLDFSNTANAIDNQAAGADTISHSDSLYFIREGLLPAPPDSTAIPSASQKEKKKKKK